MQRRTLLPNIITNTITDTHTYTKTTENALFVLNPFIKRRTRPRTRTLARLAAAPFFALLLTACGGEEQADRVLGTGAIDSEVPAQVSVTGTVTFDLVPHSPDAAGLDYHSTTEVPARGLQVQLLDEAGAVLDLATTSVSGSYSLEAPAETAVRVRVLARMLSTVAPAWSFSVTDNTRNNTLYALDGQLASSGSEDSVRNLHAVSGWNGSGYDSQRPAAPFAILDAVYDAAQQVLLADPGVVFPPLELRWSTTNIAVAGDLRQGAIGTSYYSTDDQSIYLLGLADNDTDEYDRSVITHEFAHYLEHQLSRTDSIGGAHSATTQLDMRVAFSEGWANAFAAIATQRPDYRDSIGIDQGNGLYFSVESNNYGNRGWFSENSVQKLLYDLFDTANEVNDNLSLGFTPIWQTLTQPSYIGFAGATSIFLFASELREHLGDSAAVTALLEREDIHGSDAYGTGELNSGDSGLSLPVYQELMIGQDVQACSNQQLGDFNGLDVRRYARFTLASNGRYQIKVIRSDGMANANPDFVLWQGGELLALADSDENNHEELIQKLAAGDYWLEVYEQSNADQDIATGGLVCFTVSLSHAL